jgi:hypothetical protein
MSDDFHTVIPAKAGIHTPNRTWKQARPWRICKCDGGCRAVFKNRYTTIILVFTMIMAARAEWRFLPPLNSDSFVSPAHMMNRNGRLITTEMQYDSRFARRFVIYDVPTGQRLYDRYWTQASGGEGAFRILILDTTNTIHLLFITDMNAYDRRYAPDGTMQSEQIPPGPAPFAHFNFMRISPWGPGYVHSAWYDYSCQCYYVQTSAMDLRILRTDTLNLVGTLWDLEPDGSGGYYVLCWLDNQPYLYHRSADGILQGPVMIDILQGFGAGQLCYAPGSRTLMVFSGDGVDINHGILYYIRFDPDSLTEISRELISSYINAGCFEAAQDTIWFVRQVTPHPPPPVHQGIAIWAYTQQSGWVATDSIPPSVWPLGNIIFIGDGDISVYPYLTIQLMNNRNILVRYPEP